jgi:hypothetical protein
MYYGRTVGVGKDFFFFLIVIFLNSQKFQLFYKLFEFLHDNSSDVSFLNGS